MKRMEMVKRILSLGLAVALIASSPVASYADYEGSGVNVEDTVEISEGAAPTDGDEVDASVGSGETSNEGHSETPVDEELNNEGTPIIVAGDPEDADDVDDADDLDDADDENGDDENGDDADDEDADAENEDETDKENCEHVYSDWVANGDGTHSKTCEECGDVVTEDCDYSEFVSNGDGTHSKVCSVCGDEVTEPCEFDENGICVHCGYEDPKHQITISDENGIVKITGTKAAIGHVKEVKVKEITRESDEDEFQSMGEALSEELKSDDEDKIIIDYVAYDVTLLDENDKETQPKDEIQVVFTQLELEGLDDSKSEATVYHYEDEEVSKMDDSSKVNDDTVQMTTTHFSTYIIASKSDQSPFLGSCQYVAVSTNQIFENTPENAKTSNNADIYKYTSVHVRVFYNDEMVVESQGGDKAIFVGTNTHEFTIVPTYKYRIAKVDSSYSYYTHDGSSNGNNGYVWHTDEDYIEETLDGTKLVKELEPYDYFDADGDGRYQNNYYMNIYVVDNKPSESPFKVDLFLYNDNDSNQTTGLHWPTNYSYINYYAYKNKSNQYLEMNSGGALVCKNSVNNYTGDDGGVYQGIADTKLDSNYMIKFSNYGTPGYFTTSGYDSSKTNYYTDEETHTNGTWYKKAYYNVGIPFTNIDGQYEFDSDKYGATLDTTNGVINVSDDGKRSFFLIDNNDHFGMHFSTDFAMTSTGQMKGKDCIFTFSGDDDVWVYIDDTLVLDMGGIHRKCSGSINFQSGAVTIDYLTTSANGMGKSYNMYTTSTLNESEIKNNGIHKLSVFYLERGSHQSNCSISFNLPVIDENQTVNPLEFTKVDAVDKTKTLSDVEFKLESADGKYIALDADENETVKSGEDGKVSFTKLKDKDGKITDGIKQGIYTLTETKAHDGYDLPTSTWTVIVKTGEDGKSTYTIDGLAEHTENGYLVLNSPESTLELTKTAYPFNYDNRVYSLNLTADYTGTEVVEVPGTESTDADVVLVLDASGSMTHSDAAIISAKNADDAFALLSTLDKSKIYFTQKYTNGSGQEVKSSVESYLLSTAKISNKKYYGLPSSGKFIFYNDADQSWYIKNLTYQTWKPRQSKYESHYTLNEENWKDLNDNNNRAQKITLANKNCPTTIYTNRSEVILSAAKNFVNGLSDGSRVAVISFNTQKAGAQTQCGLTSVGSGKSTITSAINNSSGHYKAGTYPAFALNHANTLLEKSTKAKYVVFFTDGDSDDKESDLTEYSNKLHNNNVTVFAAGVGTTDTTLNIVASEPKNDHIFKADSIAEIASTISSIAQTISHETRIKTGKGTVTDLIDSRFVVCNSNGEPLSNGATVGNGGKLVIEANGDQKVVWSDVSIGTGENKWSDTIYVKAKDTFFGGNKILTNGPGSNVAIDGDKTKNFPQPTVNVKLLGMAPNSNEITMWLGDEINSPAYVQWLLDNMGIPEDAKSQTALTPDEIDNLKNGTTISRDYTAGGEVLGHFEFAVTGTDNITNTEITRPYEAHTASVVGTPVETYQLSIKYVPVAVADRNLTGESIIAPVGGEVSQISSDSTYKVNVVTANLDVTKVTDTLNAVALNGATYQLEKQVTTQTGGTSWSSYGEAVTSSGEGDAKGKMLFSSLGVGTYKLTETGAPEGYAISNDEFLIDITRTNANPEDANESPVYSISIKKNTVEVAKWTVATVANEEGVKSLTLSPSDSNSADYTCNLENGIATAAFNVVDHAIYELPETGGRGIYVYTIGGVLLMMGAMLLLYKTKRNNNK